MTVDIHCDVDAAVAELALVVLGVFSLGDKQTGIGVPKIMKSHSRQSGSP